MAQKHKNLFKSSILCSVIGAVTLFSIVFLKKIEHDNIKQLVSYLIGGVFWLSMLIKIFLIILMGKLRKKSGLHEKINSVQLHIGLVSFFKTKEGIVSDVILGISLLLTMFLVILKVNYQILVMMTISILYLSFDLHCFFNGTNFRMIKYNDGLKVSEKNE